jgi:TPR repeat protein
MRALSWTVFFAILGSVAASPTATQTDPDVERLMAEVDARATAGDAVAQFSLGSVLFYTRTNLAKGAALFRDAALQAHPAAEFQMGQLYDFGLGVERNNTEALTWYRRAAEHGLPSAQRTVGDFYRQGREVEADQAEATRWYQRAADGDDLRAQYQLGQMYFDGTGVERDYTSAYVWFTLAAGQTPLEDNRKAIEELANIAAARMTPEQVAEGARRARTWLPQPRP